MQGCTLGGMTGWLAVAAVVVAVPTAARAQNNGGGGGRAGGRGGAGAVVGILVEASILHDAEGKLDLTGDHKAKADAAVTKAQQAVRDGLQGLRDAAPEDRQGMVQDVQKAITDGRAAVEAELSAPQKVTFAQATATMTVQKSSDLIDAERKATADVDADADKKKQAADLFDDAAKSLEKDKADAAAVQDDDGATAVGKKVKKTVQETSRQLVEVLGADDARTVLRAGAQAMRGTAGGGGRRQRPTTAPAN